MKNLRNIFSFIIFCFVILYTTPYINAQNNTSIYNAYINDDMNKWKSIMNQMESSNSNSLDYKLELLNYYYGYTAYHIGKEDYKQAKIYIEKAEKLIDNILKSNPDNSTCCAYKGSFLAFKISMSKIKAPLLAPESSKYINKAYDLNNNNIQAVADKANMLYYSPSLLGGDKEEAIKFYEKAIKLIESNNLTNNNWQYLSLLTSLAKRYEEMKQIAKANNIYKKILSIEPNFKQVRDNLYPEFLKKA